MHQDVGGAIGKLARLCLARACLCEMTAGDSSPRLVAIAAIGTPAPAPAPAGSAPASQSAGKDEGRKKASAGKITFL